jgi:hypothetical protein
MQEKVRHDDSEWKYDWRREFKHIYIGTELLNACAILAMIDTPNFGELE